MFKSDEKKLKNENFIKCVFPSTRQNRFPYYIKRLTWLIYNKIIQILHEVSNISFRWPKYSYTQEKKLLITKIIIHSQLSLEALSAPFWFL